MAGLGDLQYPAGSYMAGGCQPIQVEQLGWVNVKAPGDAVGVFARLQGVGGIYKNGSQ
jgi:hypothetical protein